MVQQKFQLSHKVNSDTLYIVKQISLKHESFTQLT